MAELLRIAGLVAGYGEAVVVRGIDLTLQQGKSIALLGRNGVGKTTLINSIVGVTRRSAGSMGCGGRFMTIQVSVGQRSVISAICSAKTF